MNLVLDLHQNVLSRDYVESRLLEVYSKYAPYTSLIFSKMAPDLPSSQEYSIKLTGLISKILPNSNAA